MRNLIYVYTALESGVLRILVLTIGMVIKKTLQIEHNKYYNKLITICI